MLRKALILGGTGFLGRHVTTTLRAAGWVVYPAGSADCDLRQEKQVRTFLDRQCRTWAPEAVVHLAYPGSRYGIATSVQTPCTLAADLIQMDLHVIQALIDRPAPTPRLLGMGSVCSYPEHTALPTDESQFWAGYPEPVNAAYGLAKRTQLMLLQAARQEHGLRGMHLILANMYGPGDRSGHVIRR